MPIDSGGTYVHAGLSLRLSRVSTNYVPCQPNAPVTKNRGLSIQSKRECNIANNNICFKFLRVDICVQIYVRVMLCTHENISPIDIDNERLIQI